PPPAAVVAARDAKAPPPPAPGNVAPAGAATPARTGKRFTLRLGQGYRFRDAALVVKPDDAPDIVFKYLPPIVGGLATRYNPMSQQVETGLEPTLTSPVPLLLSTHITAFDA